METYTLLRQMADSWFMLAMFSFFIGVIIFAFLPSQNKAREDARMIPMRDDQPVKDCSGACDSCTCSNDAFALKGLQNG